MDYKLELVLVPVSDVDRAKKFYVEEAGFGLIVDTPIGEGRRVVQVNPPGSACAIAFGTGMPAASTRSAVPVNALTRSANKLRIPLPGAFA